MSARSLVLEPSDNWIFAGLLALLVWLPLPWGSNSEAARAIFGVLVSLLVAGRLLVDIGGDHPAGPLPAAPRMVLLLWGLWLAWIVVQLLPLQPDFLEALSPHSYATHSAVSGIAGGQPLFSLSILPGATLDALLLSLNYFCLFWLVLVMVRRNRKRQRLLLLAVVLSGVGQALYGIVMTLSGWEYGFLEAKRSNIGLVTGTFVNRNHMAGYLELALSAGIALVLSDLKPGRTSGWREFLVSLIDLAMSPRMRIRVLMAVMVIALVLTRSRMGNIAFFSALMACGGLYMLLRHKQVFLRSLLFFVSLLAVDLLIVSENYGLRELAERIEKTDLETEQRTQVFRELQPLLDDYRWTGSGLGSFAAAYSPYRTDRVKHYFDHAHNDHLEFLIEAGWIGYGLLAGLALTVLLHGLRIVLRRSDPRACALGFVGPMALSCIAIHGLADFNLQIPAVAATLVALLALTLSCSSSTRKVRGRDALRDESPQLG